MSKAKYRETFYQLECIHQARIKVEAWRADEIGLAGTREQKAPKNS